MDLLMNGLLMAATLFAGGYCWVLGRRVQDLKSLDRGLGGSIVTLTRQVELARTTLDEARGASKETRADLDRLIGKADAAANQLKLLIAAAPKPAIPCPRRTIRLTSWPCKFSTTPKCAASSRVSWLPVRRWRSTRPRCRPAPLLMLRTITCTPRCGSFVKATSSLRSTGSPTVWVRGRWFCSFER